MNTHFQNKVVWITGANSGIGEALVLRLAAQGAKLVISARNTQELERVKTQTLHQLHTRMKMPSVPPTTADDILVLGMDLADSTAMPTLVETVLKQFGRIDILINNAGISQRALAKDSTLDVVKRLMDVNYIGTVALSMACLPVFERQGQGHIAVVSSLTGKFGSPMRSAYAASKHALHGYFDSLRAEMYAQGLRVTMICPGFIRTNISINALTGNGSAQGTMDDATGAGLSPQECASQILYAIRKEKNEVYIAGKEKMGIWLKRFFPSLFERMLRSVKVT